MPELSSVLLWTFTHISLRLMPYRGTCANSESSSSACPCPGQHECFGSNVFEVLLSGCRWVICNMYASSSEPSEFRISGHHLKEVMLHDMCVLSC